MAKKKQPPKPQQTPAGDTPPAPQAQQEKAAPKQPAWRAGLDFIAMIALAVAAALLIKAYIMDVYLIPSGSMETALHGRPDGGDRIFASKFSYRFRNPERWEVAVFIFPYESARAIDRFNQVSPDNKGQNFVKRVVGLPGETLAIGRGDIWTRPMGSSAPYERMIKPDSVQRGMWLKVYAEDFGDVSLSELERFWKILGGGAAVKDGTLLLRPGAEAVRMDYRPVVPVGRNRDRLIELPGIADRYVLRQPAQFRCKECDHLFVKTIETQNIQARCPGCGLLADETAVEFYHRRSGLPEFGRYAVDAPAARQGEQTLPRQDEYNFVPDLRVLSAFTLESRETTFSVALREDSRFVQVVAAGDGRVEIRVNGQEPKPEHRQLAAIAPGRAHTLESYIIEGRVRVFLDSGTEPVLDEQIWNDARPLPRNAPRASGVSLLAAGGEVRLDSVAVDRDVFYYSGWEHDRGALYQAMTSQGEITIGENSFFPMGDHTASSFDARSWGAVPLGLLQGPALLIWWPPDRAGVIPAP